MGLVYFLYPLMMTISQDQFIWHFFYNCPTTNNIMMYEACILGLETALKHGIRKIKVIDTLTLHLGKFRVIGILEV